MLNNMYVKYGINLICDGIGFLVLKTMNFITVWMVKVKLEVRVLVVIPVTVTCISGEYLGLLGKFFEIMYEVNSLYSI